MSSSIHSTVNLSLPCLEEETGKKEGMRNWSELCDDILGVIVDRLSEIEDIVRFGAVCRPWRSVSVKELHLSMVYPWLILAEKKEDDNDSDITTTLLRGFYSLSTKKVYNLNLPETRGRRIWSSCGWLITFGLDLEIHLLNPFSRVQIRLPPQPTLPSQYVPNYTPEGLRRIFIKKIILSSTPSLLVKTTTSTSTSTSCEDDDECVVAMAICSQYGKLAFSRLRDEVWTPVDNPKCVLDIIYFNGQFYAIDVHGKLLIFDISNSNPTTFEFADPPEGIWSEQYYLVESLGELFMVVRDYLNVDDDGLTYLTTGFRVYKFNFDDKKWTEVKSLDNRAMFVGDNTSFAIFPSTDHPGCEPNCVYYTDDHEANLYKAHLYRVNSGYDAGVFSMEKQASDVHYDGPDMLSGFCTPIWFSHSQ